MAASILRRCVVRLLAVAVLFAWVTPAAHAEQSLGDKLRAAFKPTPTPAPRHRKKKKATEASDPEKKATPKPQASPSPSPTGRKKSAPASDDDEEKPSAKKSGADKSPTPTPKPTATPTPEATASPSATPTAVIPPNERKHGAPATIAPGEIADYEKYPSPLRRVTDLGLDLAGRNLQYKYGSADPANGGMDCSGFVNYVLTQTGVRDVPRDSSQLYVWARKAGTFRAVNSRADDSFELNELKPGDLLFWTGTYSIERDPPITHAMIYLGREKKTGHRIMVGASDGRTYQGESRFGVSVFDFKIAHPPRDKEAKLTPSFIGYAHVPGLNDG